MHILVYSMGTKATRRKAAVHYTHSLSHGNMKNLMPRSFTFVCQLYCCSSKHNNKKALRITFNSCETVSTSSMALATVNIDKIVKVTSASSYVLGQQFPWTRIMPFAPSPPLSRRSVGSSWTMVQLISRKIYASFLWVVLR